MSDTIATLWEQHREAGWPAFQNPQEGQLMTLDTVISGCVMYYLDTPDGLDDQRDMLLRDCLADLDTILPSLEDKAASAYFSRLRALGGLLLDSPPGS